MNQQLVNMVEAMKAGTYSSYAQYFEKGTEEEIVRWFAPFALDDNYNMEDIVKLMYQLYLDENMDFSPCEDYSRQVSYLAERYKFDKSRFIDLYQQFRKMLFGGYSCACK